MRQRLRCRRRHRSLGFRFALLVTGMLTLAIGIYPEPFLRFARIVPAAMRNEYRSPIGWRAEVNTMEAVLQHPLFMPMVDHPGDRRRFPAGCGLHRAGRAQGAGRHAGAARTDARRARTAFCSRSPTR